MKASLRAVRALVLPALLAGCASTDPELGPAGLDPYEETNRSIHAFNVGLDRAVLDPVSEAYGFVTPTLFQELIRNGLNTLALPVDFFNHLLQGEPMPALRTAGRLGVNVVLGLGVLNPADEFGLPREETDFGVTLGKWGVDSGPYLVLPFVGPSTPRDVAGFGVDLVFTPTSSVALTGSDLVNVLSLPLRVVDVVDTRHRNSGQIESVLYESADGYATLRSVYFQRRDFLISGGDTGAALPDIFEEDEVGGDAPEAPAAE